MAANVLNESQATAGTVQVLLVDDHALFRAGLRMLLQTLRRDLCVYETASMEHALTLLRDHAEINLCLLDLDLRSGCGLASVRQIRGVAPTVAVVVVSAEDDPAIVNACIDQGAMSYIPKSATPDTLTLALTRVLAGDVFLPRQDGSAGPNDAAANTGIKLTARQKEVLAQLNRGLPTKLIARELGLSEFTVKDHLTDLFKVLGVRSRTEAVIRASRMTLHPPPAVPK